MISCEEFESRYPLDQSAEILHHKKSCPFCSQFSEAIASFRNSAAALPCIPAPIGFEYRLQKRVELLEAGPIREWRILPKAAAFASGIAVILIAGALYHGIDNSSNPAITAGSDAEEIAVTEIESDSTAVDSMNAPVSPWADSWNYEAVSAQP